ncbi:MAG: hypothetical protein H0U34_09140 [Sphingomonas sp.]|nr:hypothetical protein [Sphingomonas sp.]
MTVALLLSLLPTLFGFSAAAQSDQVRTLVVQQEVIVRVPVRAGAMPPALEWTEHKGPACLATSEVRGASLSGREHVDFLLHDRRRVRAELSADCPALDFYNGFYLRPEEGRICARRDSVHSRMGMSCRIERFHRLAAQPRRPLP